MQPPWPLRRFLTSFLDVQRQSEIKSALDKANTERDRSKDSTKGIIELLKANRARMSNASREKEKCYQALRDMTAARQAQQKSLQDMRRSLKFQVRPITHMNKTSSCNPPLHRRNPRTPHPPTPSKKNPDTVGKMLSP
jgi:hypothetical protein